MKNTGTFKNVLENLIGGCSNEMKLEEIETLGTKPCYEVYDCDECHRKGFDKSCPRLPSKYQAE